MNIFDTGPWPSTVTIIGNGPNGAEYLGLVNSIVPGFRIALNRAAEFIPAVNYWVCRDAGLARMIWFKTRLRQYATCPSTVFCRQQLGSLYPGDYHYDFLNWPLGYPPHGAIYPRFVRGGGTITADAIQIAVQKSCTRIILIGVDMHGPGHITGETAIPANLLPDGTWIQRDRLDLLIAWLHSFGAKSPSGEHIPHAQRPCHVYSLGNTTLVNSIRITAENYKTLCQTS